MTHYYLLTIQLRFFVSNASANVPQWIWEPLRDRLNHMWVCLFLNLNDFSTDSLFYLFWKSWTIRNISSIKNYWKGFYRITRFPKTKQKSCFIGKFSVFNVIFQFEKWRAFRASVGGVGGVLAWVAC